MPLEEIRVEDAVVGIRLAGKNFFCDDESGEIAIEKKFLFGFKLSDIPESILIKPVEAVEGDVIHVDNNVAISLFDDNSACALVEVMLRRKSWDGEIGLSPYVTSLRQAINERDGVAETDFEDDGDYVFLRYEVEIAEDMEIQAAIHMVDTVIAAIEHRAEELAARRRDPLLAVFDRGSFESDLRHVMQTTRDGVGLVMVDLDHFKAVNDTYGHQVGDEVLRAVASALASLGSGNTTTYRYGGEELALIVTKTDKAATVEVAEAARRAVEALGFENPPLAVTVSLGLAVAPGGAATAEALIRKADAALYTAKRDGRNCVRTAPDSNGRT